MYAFKYLYIYMFVFALIYIQTRILTLITLCFKESKESKKVEQKNSNVSVKAVVPPKVAINLLQELMKQPDWVCVVGICMVWYGLVWCGMV